MNVISPLNLIRAITWIFHDTIKLSPNSQDDFSNVKYPKGRDQAPHFRMHSREIVYINSKGFIVK
jgi:hypothetical protein